MQSFDEIERPAEWLRRFAENRIAYHSLLRESGGLARAAYRLARARCMAQLVPTRIPTMRELSVAAAQVAQNVEVIDRVPNDWSLAEECEDSGLPVITPIAPPVTLRH